MKIINDFVSSVIKKKEEPILHAESIRGDLLPLYVILVSGSGYLSKSIRAYTRGVYSHAALMLRYYETVSMGVVGKGNGILVESMLEMVDNGRDGNVKIMRKFITVEQYKKIVDRVSFYKINRSKISYSWSKLRNFIPFIPKHSVTKYKDENSFICTEFVSYIMSEIEDYANTILVDRGRGSKMLVTADEMSRGLKEVFDVIYEGAIYELPSALMYELEKPYNRIKETIDRDSFKKLSKAKQYNEHTQVEDDIHNKKFDYTTREDILLGREQSLIFKMAQL